MCKKHGLFFVYGLRNRNIQKPGHEFPEPVLRVSVIELVLPGLYGRETSQDQDTGVCVKNRVKGVLNVGITRRQGQDAGIHKNLLSAGVVDIWIFLLVNCVCLVVINCMLFLPESQFFLCNLCYTISYMMREVRLLLIMGEIASGRRKGEIMELDEKQNAVSGLLEDFSEEHLWECIVAFQGESFLTMSGLPYTYTLKQGKRGGFTRELWVDRRENSKSITWSSVRMAFQNVLKMKEALPDGGKPYVKRPKALGDIRGVSYIYPLFSRIGLIETNLDRERTCDGQLCMQLEENTEGETA